MNWTDIGKIAVIFLLIDLFVAPWITGIIEAWKNDKP